MNAIERARQERLQRTNAHRIGRATEDALIELISWLNLNEPHLLNEALEEVGL